jgi:NitT/TauT family transport system substrate-binding protein
MRNSHSLMRRFAVVAALVAGLLAGAEARAEQHVWRHGLFDAKSDSGILFMITRGFAEKQGLKLEMVTFKTDSTALKALLAGDLDSYDGILNGTVLANLHGADTRMIGCHWPGLPHAFFVRKDINSVQDLRGKTFAISTPFTLPDVLADALLQKYGMKAEDMHFAPLGGDVERYKAVVAGVADATVVSGEYAPIAARDGVKMLLPARDVVPNYLRVCLFSTERKLHERKDDAVRFLAAEMNALHYAMSHRDEALKLSRELTGMKPDDPRPEYIYDDAVHTHAVDPDLNIPMEKVTFMINLLIKSGKVPANFDPRSMVDPSIREQALARVRAAAPQ